MRPLMQFVATVILGLACVCSAHATVPAAPLMASTAQGSAAATQNAAGVTTGPVKFWSGLTLSPHGRHMAFATDTIHGPRLEVADAQANHARVVAIPGHTAGCRTSDATWAPDGATLAFLSNCGNKNPAQRDIYLVAATAGTLTARRLTDLDGYVRAPTWAPDGRSLGILYVAGDTHPTAAIAASKPRVGVIGVSGVEHQRMALVNARTGAVSAITPASLFVYEYSFAPNGRAITYIGAPPPGANNWWTAKLYTQRLGGHSPTMLVDPWHANGSLRHLQMAHPRFSPDGETIAFIGGLMSDQGVTGGDIYTVPAAGGPAVDVTPGIHFSPSWFTWTGHHQLLASAYHRAGTSVGLFTLHGSQPASHRQLFTTPATIWAPSVSADHSRLAFVHATFTSAPEIYAATLNRSARGNLTGLAAPAHAITHANAAIRPRWGKAVEINWKNDGYNISGWLLLPAHYDAHKTYPLIVQVHGGPVYAIRASWPRGLIARLAEAGYFVFMPNPRGSLGQGAAFTQAIRRDMGYGDLRDILAGLDAVEKQYPIARNRIGIEGWSYGGFMAMFAPTQTHRFKAAVAGAGLSDWLSYYGENMISEWMLPFFGASVYADPAVYAKSSAINFISQNKTPTLLVVGQYDKECPAPQSFEMWHGLRAYGIPTELVVYAGEGHGFHRAADREDVTRRTLAWFAKYLAP